MTPGFYINVTTCFRLVIEACCEDVTAALTHTEPPPAAAAHRRIRWWIHKEPKVRGDQPVGPDKIPVSPTDPTCEFSAQRPRNITMCF